MSVGCVVVAAGRGRRAGLGYNKAFYRMDGRCVLFRTLDALNTGSIDEIVLVLGREDGETYETLVRSEGACPLVRCVVTGGETRRDSVYAGLKALSPGTDIVLVHDGVRPFVSREIIENVIRDARRFGSGVISTPMTDTVKRVDGEGNAVGTLNRDTLRCVQTPQAFDYEKLLRAHEALPADDGATDDAYLYEKLYGSVHLTEAADALVNRKLTTIEDIKSMEKSLIPALRIGTGYDVHRLTEGRKLVLCGVEIPFEKGLLGHSDADVAVHALMDALLGAAALGDIGKLFPDSDEKYKGISSMRLLREVEGALDEHGFRVENCDITIVCQRPKLAGYIPEMRSRIAQTLKIEPERVSVKATTTEGLGFEGEGLGISARASALIKEK